MRILNPIVDKQLFETVQKHFKGRKRPSRAGELDKYAGYLYCAQCGSRLYLHRAYSMEKSKNYYAYGGYQTLGSANCTSHYIRESVIDSILLETVRRTVIFASEESEAFYEMAMEKGEAEADKLVHETEAQIKSKEKRFNELENI